MRNFKRIACIAAISLPVLTGCVNPDGVDDPNAATKQGAAGGALLGLTLGALTGESDLAVKGAIAGGVAGGVTGAGVDLQNNRENIRSNNRNEAISGVGNSGESTPQVWTEIDRFVGDWQVNVQNIAVESDLSGLQATGSLASISNADINITRDKQALLHAKFSYSQDHGYELKVVNQTKNISVDFSGERVNEGQRYNFYPTNSDSEIYAGIPAADTRIELGLISEKVWVIDAYAFIDGEERKVQTYRFTKS